MTEEYYLQNIAAGYLGNAPTWWAKGGNGYTAYILGAERFSREAAQKYVMHDPEKFAMHKCADIDARLHLVFDSQDFENLGTDAPCGWASGYAPALNPTDPSQHLPEKLPCDVTIGAAIFRRGVPTRFVLDKIQWWQDMVDKGETPPVNRRPTADCTCTVKERYSGHRIDCDVPQREGSEVEQHFDDVAVYVLAKAMKSKLAQKRSEGRSGWQSPDECSQEFLSKLLREHVEKGDPVDVANFCMMLFNRGERIEQIPNRGEVDQYKRSEKMTELAYKWAHNHSMCTHHPVDVDMLEENIRQCLEEWCGETRQDPIYDPHIVKGGT